jgi:hypothetical protein
VLNNEELKYKQVIEGIEGLEVIIPNDLHEIVEDRIQNISYTNKNGFINVIAKSVAIITISFLCILMFIYNNDNFATFASSIPGLNIITKWIYQDKGLQIAHDNEYPYIEDLVYEQDGYTLTLANIMIDEERINFNALIKGNGFRLDNYNNTDTTSYWFMFRFADVDYCGTTRRISTENNESAINVDMCFYNEHEEEYLGNLIKEQKDIQLECYITKHIDDEIEKVSVIKDINIPVNKDNVLLSKVYNIDKKIELDKGIIRLNKLVISPTRMRVIVRTSSLGEGVNNIQLNVNDFYIKDDRGNIYKGSGSVSSCHNKDCISYDFVPSVYFNNNIDKLYLHYNNYSYSYKEKYKISLNESFPKIINYHGYEIIITEIKYEENDLIINMEYDESKNFRVEGLNISQEGDSKSCETYKTENIKKMKTTIKNVDYMQSYEIELEYPQIIIEEKGMIRIK